MMNKVSVSVLLVVAIVLVVIAVAMYGGKMIGQENFDGQEVEIAGEVQPTPVEKATVEPVSEVVLSAEDKQIMEFKKANVDMPTDLLPASSTADAWVTEIDSGLTPPYRSFIDAGQHIGTDTRGGVMKNPNLQIRSDPPISREATGPWNNSSIQKNPT